MLYHPLSLSSLPNKEAKLNDRAVASGGVAITTTDANKNGYNENQFHSTVAKCRWPKFNYPAFASVCICVDVYVRQRAK